MSTSLELSVIYHDGHRPEGREARVRLTTPRGPFLLMLPEETPRLEKRERWESFTSYAPEDQGRWILVSRNLPQQRITFVEPVPPDFTGAKDQSLGKSLARRLLSIPRTTLGWLTWGSGLALTAGALMFFGMPALAVVTAWVIPQSWEEKLGERVWTEMENLPGFKALPQTPAQQALWAQVEQRLSRHLADGRRVRITVVESPIMNAMALPGGRMVVFKGMLDKLETPDQLAALLGHELGHVVHRHSMRGLIHAKALEVGLSLATGGDRSLAGMMESLGQSLAVMKFSRDQESDADKYALEFLREENLPDRAALELLTLLHKENPETGVAIPTLLQTHPGTLERIQTVGGALGPTLATGHFLSPENWRILKGRVSMAKPSDKPSTPRLP
ncbi:MAG: M48 family metallopeptidase [Deltaproteobacteria bacterium]|nr:M48 family metallopeptidase [Deltaproteobacteria bacterium]